MIAPRLRRSERSDMGDFQMVREIVGRWAVFRHAGRRSTPG